MDLSKQVRVPWYQRWTTYLTGLSALLGIIIIITQQGFQLENFVAPVLQYFLHIRNASHDVEFEKKLEEVVFSYQPSVDSLSKLFEQTPLKREEKLGGPTSGIVFSGYSFENDNILLFFVTSKPNPNGTTVSKEKSASLNSEHISAIEDPAALVIGFKKYPEFVKRIFKADQVNQLNKVTIKDLQRIYAGHNVMSAYDASYAGNFITIFGAGANIFHEGNHFTYASVFFFPNVVGCGTMDVAVGSVNDFDVKFKDKSKQSAWINYKSPPNHLDFSRPLDEFPLVMDELDCSDLDAVGYLLGMTAYSWEKTHCTKNCSQSDFDVGNYSSGVTWEFFLLNYADAAVGYTNRKLESIKPQE